MRISYREAVEFIALNDEPTENDPEAIAAYTTTVMLAHISGREPAAVAYDVLRVRNREAIEQSGARLHLEGLL